MSRSPEVVSLLQGHTTAGMTLLALALGGDLSPHEGFDGSRGRAGALPRARTAAIRAALPKVEALLQSRLDLLNSGPGFPPEWAAYAPYSVLVDQ